MYIGFRTQPHLAELEEARAERRSHPDVENHRATEDERYEAFRRMCDGVYTSESPFDPRTRSPLEPDWSITLGGVGHVMDQLRGGVHRHQHDLELGKTVWFLHFPDVPLAPCEVQPVEQEGHRIGFAFGRVNFQKIDELFQEHGYFVYLVNPESVKHFTEAMAT